MDDLYVCGNCESFVSDCCFIQQVPVKFETRACGAFEPEELDQNYTDSVEFERE